MLHSLQRSSHFRDKGVWRKSKSFLLTSSWSSTFSQKYFDSILSAFVRRDPQSGRHEHQPVPMLTFDGLLQEEHKETGPPSLKASLERVMPGSTPSLPNRPPSHPRAHWLEQLRLNTATIPRERGIANSSIAHWFLDFHHVCLLSRP